MALNRGAPNTPCQQGHGDGQGLGMLLTCCPKRPPPLTAPGDGGLLGVTLSMWTGFSLCPASRCLCLPACKREVMTGVMTVPRIAKHFCKMLRTPLHRQSGGLGTGWGVLVLRRQLHQQRLVFHVMMCHDLSLPSPLSSPGHVCMPITPIKRDKILLYHYLCHEACPLDFIISWVFHHQPIGQCPRQCGTCIKELRASQCSIHLPALDSHNQRGKSSSWKPLGDLSPPPSIQPLPCTLA